MSTYLFSLDGQTVLLKGEQKIDVKNKTPELICTPVKVTKKMKITKVEGDCKGFWIQKGSITTNKFTNLDDAIGTVLKPGIYYVYPYLKKGETTANVSVTLVSDSS